MRTWEFIVDRGVVQQIVDQIKEMNGVENLDELAREDPRRLFEHLMRLMYQYNTGYQAASYYPMNVRTSFNLNMKVAAFLYDDLPTDTMVSLGYYHELDQPLTLFAFFKVDA